MAKQIINTGNAPNDGSGDGLRTAGGKINQNFNELYSVLGDSENLLNTDIDFGPNKIFYSNLFETEQDLQAVSASTYHGMVAHVHETGSLYYAHANQWRKLLTSDPADNITNYDDPLDAVAYTGNYSDLRNRPTLPSAITDLGIVDGSAGQVLSTDGTGNFTFRDIQATSIDFINVTNKPTTLAGYGINDAFTGRYEDLTGTPSLFSGAYADLTGKPAIPADLSDLTDNDTLLFDGDYDSLANLPSIPADLSDLTDANNLLFSRDYLDLSNKPTAFSSLSSLSMSLGVTIDEFSNDDTMTDNSASALVTERAVKTYVAAQLGGLRLINLGIAEGTAGQVLTTDGAGTYTFETIDTDTIGNFTIANSNIDTDDSSAITITPSVIAESNMTVQNDLTVTNDIFASTITISEIITEAVGDPELFSENDLTLTATNSLVIASANTRIKSTTDVEGEIRQGGQSSADSFIPIVITDSIYSVIDPSSADTDSTDFIQTVWTKQLERYTTGGEILLTMNSANNDLFVVKKFLFSSTGLNGMYQTKEIGSIGETEIYSDCTVEYDGTNMKVIVRSPDNNYGLVRITGQITYTSNPLSVTISGY